MKAIITVLSLLVISFNCNSQQYDSVPDAWELFGEVPFKRKFFPEHNSHFLAPDLSGDIKKYEGKQITVTGHFIPYELEDTNSIILSKFPYAACFFCGGAGPESVVEVRFKSPPMRFKPDQILEITGTLVLNDDDVNHLNFILENPKFTVR